MISTLYKGLTEQQKKELNAAAMDAKPVIRQVMADIQRKMKACEQHRRSRKNYFMPSWKQYQADCNGYLRGLEETFEVLKSISDQGATK